MHNWILRSAAKIPDVWQPLMCPAGCQGTSDAIKTHHTSCKMGKGWAIKEVDVPWKDGKWNKSLLESKKARNLDTSILYCAVHYTIVDLFVAFFTAKYKIYFLFSRSIISSDWNISRTVPTCSFEMMLCSEQNWLSKYSVMDADIPMSKSFKVCIMKHL